MRKVLCILIIFVLLSLFNYLPFSYSASGESVYKTKCGACHGRGLAPDFSPAKYASLQWKRFFEKNKHARKRDLSNDISPADMSAAKVYLMSHAADSDLPIATGIR
ncbi:MAG: cytochrome c [Thermodesulfobacteriota bacterium]|nr:cytochrome c [Thermodesulfobacteriota bacterium]